MELAQTPEDQNLSLGGEEAPPTSAEGRPLARGWIHFGAAIVFALFAPLFFLKSPDASASFVLAIYVFSMESLFVVSALFHRVRWGERGRRRMRRLDHSTIFLAIAGSNTAVAGLALHGAAEVAILLIVWIGGAAGVAIRQLWLDAPKWVNAIPYVVVGWSALLVLPELLTSLGGWGVFWLLAGGLAYTAGALCYALQRPNPVPGVFGYHELFHAGTAVGAACHWVVIYFFALDVAIRLHG